MIKDIPVVFANVTDPVSAGLASSKLNNNITGASDRQDLTLMLKFAQQLF